MGDKKRTTARTLPPRRRGAGRPPRHVAEAIDEQLFDAARTLFCSRGIAGTSMEEVADHAGIAKQTIYRRYPGKAALIEAVVDRDLKQMMAEPMAGNGPPLTRLRQLRLKMFTLSLLPENLLFVGFLMAEAAYAPELRQRFRVWSARIREPTIRLLEEAMADGSLPRADIPACAHLLDSLLSSATEQIRFAVPDPFDGLSPDQWFEKRWQAFLTLMRA